MSRVYYNEIERFPCDVIRANIERGRLPEGRVDQRDIRDVQPTELVGFSQLHLFAGIGAAAYACCLAGVPDSLSLATAGFPCQDISCAGTRAGLEGARSGLFWDLLALLEGARPRWVLLENVPALRTAGAGADPDGLGAAELVCCGLEEIGYRVIEPVVVGADDVGASHRRKRVWIVARCLDYVADAEHDARGAQWQPEPGQRPDEGPQQIAVSGRDGAVANGQSISAQGDLPARGGVGQPSRAHRECGGDVADAQGFAQREPHHGHHALAVGGAARQVLGGAGAVGDATRARSRRVSARSRRQGLRAPHANRTGSTLAISDGQRGATGLSGQAEPRGQGLSEIAHHDCYRWPARPGEPQHDWEEPRAVEPSLGAAADGTSERLVRRAQREWTAWRNAALKGAGNAWCPQSAVPILQWIVAQDAALIKAVAS